MIYSSNYLSGKTFLITGASSGIGRSTAKLLSDCGARIIASGRNQERLDELLAALPRNAGHSVVTHSFENADEVADWITGLSQEHGPLDGVFHAAGIELIRPARMTKQSHLDSLFASSLYAAFGIARAAGQKNVLKDSASLVFMSSVAGQTGQIGMTAYSAAKAGLDGLVRSLACELAPRKIRVNSIAAGAVDTAMHQRLLESSGEETKAVYESSHLLGFGQPDDIANVAAFLLGDAGKWITGTVMVVDGGYMVR